MSDNSTFIAFQRHNDEDPWGHELLININSITRIEVMYFTNPDSNGECGRLSLKAGRENTESSRWFKVYVPGDSVTVTKRHGRAYEMIAEIWKNSHKSENG